MSLEAHIEAVLFVRAEPISKSELVALFNVDAGVLESALRTLADSLTGRGITLVDTGTVVELRTAAAASELLAKIRKEELSKDLSKASLETLSIILYRGPISRSDIDYLRGVNSTFILRSLLIRGLIERVENPDDERSYLYRTTTELLGHLGIAAPSDLPEYAAVSKEFVIAQEPNNQTQ